MDKFKIAVTYRVTDRFVQHNIEPESEITGVMTLITDRCDVENILAEYNVAQYQIVQCSNLLQVMREPKKIPEFYYEEATV